MTSNLYHNSGLSVIQEEDKKKLPPPNRSEVKPQYVHLVAPQPPPEVSVSIPRKSGLKRRCVKFSVAAVLSLLLLLLVAIILLAYYLSSACMHGLQCGDVGCVWESQWCDGVVDCPAGQDEAHCVRLQGSSFLLQIYSTRSKTWRTVCSQGWTEQQGRASCQQFGYSRGTYFKSGTQQTDSDDGFLMVKSDFKPEASILQQLVLSDSCPNHSAVTLRCTDCGSGLNSSTASPGGQVTSPSVWPWQVSLQVDGSHRCGGAVISPYWTITAAHCVTRTPNPEDWVVYAGIVDGLGTLFNPAYSVSHIVAHEGFDSATHRNDIALMRLSKPLDITASSNIRPVCLPNVGLNITAPQTGWITHFVHRNGDSNSPYLMEDQVSLMDTADCNSSVAYNGELSQDMLCAEETEADMCRTESGGPLVSLKDGVWWLVGDSIWGKHCSQQNKPGVYGNVTYFLDWIHHQMRKHQYD